MKRDFIAVTACNIWVVIENPKIITTGPTYCRLIVPYKTVPSRNDDVLK